MSHVPKLDEKMAAALLPADDGEDGAVTMADASASASSSSTHAATPSDSGGSADADTDAHKRAVAQIVDMGFSAAQAEHALKQTATGEEALNWLLTATETQLKEAEGASSSLTAKSYKCTTTGKLFRTMADAMIYAERTGHTDFEESSEEVPPLTAEEKAERLKKVKELIKVKAAAREEQEKKDQLDRERKRRQEGKNMGQIREEHEAIQRKRELELREKEKARYKAEQERLREEVARDKAERAADKARRLKTGDPRQAYEEAYARAIKGHGDGDKPLGEKVEAVLKVLELARVGNKGADALRTVNKMLGNVANNPAEPKFRRVNLQNETFKAKVGSVMGGVALLKLAGFQEVKAEDGGAFLELPQDADVDEIARMLEITSAAERSSRFAPGQ